MGNLRAWLFTPLARFASFAALNAWLSQRCWELGARQHPVCKGSIASHWASERTALRPMSAVFDGYVEAMLRVSSTCLVCVDRNRYSVPAIYAGKAVSVRSRATHIEMVADAIQVAQHVRCFGRDQLICDPWHYLPILENKPGALRHGAPFVQWELP
ncbi:hypothetical protein WAE56_21125 [Iodobacter sp. LRB]|uniref:Mu transposase domain-containing protein n=1 Tax=unclassified Iodobacter TaxID=235634 RepID=UPI000C0ED5D3|nr:hypothetical protein [Iodobacter sp. BJB302]PHU99469.1 hypothetical protein CSQ88_22345 [Iodobacter sp. BJB302]